MSIGSARSIGSDSEKRRLEVQVDAQDAAVDQGEAQQVARLRDAERFLELALQHLHGSRGVGRDLVQRRREIVGECEHVVDADVDHRNRVVQESELFELLQEVDQRAQRAEDVVEADVVEVEQVLEALGGDRVALSPSRSPSRISARLVSAIVSVGSAPV